MRILQSQHKPTRKVTTVNTTDVVTVVYCLGHDQTVRHKTCTQTSLTHRNHRLKLQNPETGHQSTSSTVHVPGYICSIAHYSPSSCSEHNTFFFRITFYITFPSNLICTLYMCTMIYIVLQLKVFTFTPLKGKNPHTGSYKVSTACK